MEIIKAEKNIIKNWSTNLEEGAIEQALNLANHPVIDKPVALMPDAHMGKGMPIGGVVACTKAVIPNAVGVDIGCGMIAVRTDLKFSEINRENLENVVNIIKKTIPVGFSVHSEAQYWEEFENYQLKGVGKWCNHNNWKRIVRSLGTLGGGNHFWEIQKSEDDIIWIMIHSGSRNLGKLICDYYHKRAIELNTLWHSKIPCKELAFLPEETTEFEAYLRDMNFALCFAYENRKRMMDRTKEALNKVFGKVNYEEEINIHHNYASLENHFGKNYYIHRKGATLATKKKKGIIPGSMGTFSYIVQGLDNSHSYCSCSHGAGRKMSKTEANLSLSHKEADEIMKKQNIIYDRWNKVERGRAKGNLDISESPLAYKDIDEVMNNQKDLVSVLTKLSPIASRKG